MFCACGKVFLTLCFSHFFFCLQMTQKDITFVADFLTEHFNEVSYIGLPSIPSDHSFAAKN